MKLNCYVFEPDSGEIEIQQSGGSKQLVERYGDIGKTARTFDRAPDGLSDVSRLFVDPKQEKLLIRPTMSASVDRTEIRADGSDVATIKGLPDHCRVTVFDGLTEATYTPSGRIVQIAADHPATYTITLDAFPHRARMFQIIAR